jgi:cytochrome c556
MLRFRTAWMGGLAALVLAMAMAASWADDDMANIIKYRQGLMKANADHARDIGMILKGEVPFDARHVQEQAVALNAMSKLIIQCFPKGSGAAAGKTRAKDDIWTHWDKFMADAVALQKETEKLIEVTKTGNMSQITTQMAIVGNNSCGDCHDDFRKPE